MSRRRRELSAGFLAQLRHFTPTCTDRVVAPARDSPGFLTCTYRGGMTSAPSGPLAKIVDTIPAGTRLKFLPHPSLELGSAVSIWLRFAAALAVPAAVMVSLLAVLFGGVANWLLFVAITAGVFFVVIFTAATAFQVHKAWSRYRSLELRTAVTAAQVAVVGGWFGRRSQVIPVADLRGVVVAERLKLGRREALDVVLHIGGDELVTLAADNYATRKVSAGELTTWLRDQLSPAHVTVRHETEVDKNFLCPDQWWRAGTVASMWRVPLSEVASIAGRHDVRTYTYTPREYAMYSPTKTVTLYDPGTAFEVAQELHAQRSAQSKT